MQRTSAVARIQAAQRGRNTRRDLKWKRRSAQKIQAFARGRLARERSQLTLRKKAWANTASTKIQARWRGRCTQRSQTAAIAAYRANRATAAARIQQTFQKRGGQVGSRR